MARSRTVGVLAAVAAFLASGAALVLAMPFFVMLVSGCFSFHESCADGAGWATLIGAPLALPIIFIVSIIIALATFSRVTREPY